MEVHKLVDHKRIVLVPFLGEKTAVEYDVHGYDQSIYVDFMKLAKLKDEDPARLRVNLRILGKMVIAWDLTNGCTPACAKRKKTSADPICREHATPVTAQAIADLPHLFRGQMVSQIMADVHSGGDAAPGAPEDADEDADEAPNSKGSD